MGEREHEPPVRAQHVGSAREGGSRQHRQESKDELREYKSARHLSDNAYEQTRDRSKAEYANRIVTAASKGLEPALVQGHMGHDSDKQARPQILMRRLLHEGRCHHGDKQPCKHGIHYNASSSHAVRPS